MQKYRNLKIEELDPIKIQLKTYKSKHSNEIFRNGHYKGMTAQTALEKIEKLKQGIYAKKTALEKQIQAAVATAGSAQVDVAEQRRVKAMGSLQDAMRHLEAQRTDLGAVRDAFVPVDDGEETAVAVDGVSEVLGRL